MTVLGNYNLLPNTLDGVEFYATREYWDMTEQEKDDHNYACGPGKFGYKYKFLLGTIWFLNVEEPCRIHDDMYRRGKSQFDKWVADVTFLTNLNDLIEAKSWFGIKELRRYRAMTYFSAVRDNGDECFWNGKTKPS